MLNSDCKVITVYKYKSSLNFVCFQVETNKVFLRDTTIVSPFSILLFGGSINVQHQVSILSTATYKLHVVMLSFAYKKCIL